MVATELNGLVCSEKIIEATKDRSRGQVSVRDVLEKKLSAFEDEIQNSPCLSIDGLLNVGDTVPGTDIVVTLDSLKVDNNHMEQSFLVPVDEIVRADKAQLKALIRSLEDNVMIRVDSITRIVGYYSRVHNWNSSKAQGELVDRRNGYYNFGDGNAADPEKRINSEKSRFLNE